MTHQSKAINLAGKRILLTGATSGIGRAAAQQIAGMGARLVLHGRNRQKAEAVRQEIIRSTGNKDIDFLIADLTIQEEVLKMADTFNGRYEALDILINNAGGVMNKTRELTGDGREKTMALNVLSPFALSILLYPKLRVNTGTRVINTASMAHRSARPDLDDFMYERSYNAIRAYGDAKLFLILLGKEFTRRQSSPDVHKVAMNAFHPGVVATDFAADSNSLYHFFFRFFRMFLISPEKGADTVIWLAAQEHPGSGGYYARRKPARIHSNCNTPVFASRLWEHCVQYTGVDFQT